MLVLILPESSTGGLEERHACDRLMVDLRADVILRGSRTSVPDEADFVAVVTDPLFVPGANLLSRLTHHLESNPWADVAVPVASVSPAAHQRIELNLDYSTPSEFAASTVNLKPVAKRIRWTDGIDPGVALVRSSAYRRNPDPLQLLREQDVVLCEDAVIHRFEPLRGNRRDDLFAHVPANCRSILEIGCGEGALGARIRSERGSRVVGIELDPAAASIASTRLDDVRLGEIESLLPGITEQFDCIVAGDILEHLVDPWDTLRQLHRNLAAGGVLVASIPNIASWPVIADLLRGRFDYVYAGLLCSGHLRFFTRQSIEEMFEMSGWSITSIEPQPGPVREEHTKLVNALKDAGLKLPPDGNQRGFIVTASLRQ